MDGERALAFRARRCGVDTPVVFRSESTRSPSGVAARLRFDAGGADDAFFGSGFLAVCASHGRVRGIPTLGALGRRRLVDCSAGADPMRTAFQPRRFVMVASAPAVHVG